MIDTEKNILAIDFLYLYKAKKYCGQKKKKDKKNPQNKTKKQKIKKSNKKPNPKH